MISKKLTSKAGITIPKALRADLGWQPSMAVDLAPQEDGSLIIRPCLLYTSPSPRDA